MHGSARTRERLARLVRARAHARATRPARPGTHALLALCGVLLIVALAGAGSSALGAGAPVVVTMTVASEVDLTNSCVATPATQLGTVLPGGTGITATTSGNVCSVSWHSSNDTSMLQMGQRDGVGAAMGLVGSWTYQPYDNVTLKTVGSSDATHAFAAGRNGTIVRWVSGTGWTGPWNPNGGGEWYSDIEAVDMNTWYAVGSATLLRITSAQSPTPTFSANLMSSLTSASPTAWPVGNDLNGIAVASSTTAVVVGANGWVAKTTTLNNATPSWTVLHLPGQPDLFDVDWAGAGNPNAYVAVGDQHEMINNATFSIANWTTAGTNPSAEVLRNLAITGPNTYYAVGDSGAIETCTVANCLVQANANASWVNASNSTLVVDAITAVAGSTAVPGTAWAFSERGQVFQTTNSGSSWARQTSATETFVGGATALAANSVLAVGDDQTIAQTSDGSTWTASSLSAAGSVDYNDVDASPVNGQVAVEVGDLGTIQRSTNSGTSWTLMSSTTSQPLLGVSFASSSVVWAVGEHGTILQSTDAGVTWTAQTSPTTARLWSVDSYDETTAWAVGDGGVTITTTNGGITWSIVPSGTSQNLRGVSVDTSTPNHVVAVGSNSTVLYTTTGTSWTAGTAPANESMSGVSWGSSTVAWAQQNGSYTVLISVDGGATWNATASTLPGGWGMGIEAVNSKIAYVSGGARFIWRTTDGGATWTNVGTTSNPIMYGVAAVDSNTAYATGQSGENATTGPSGAANTTVTDYGAAPNNWLSAGGLFGVCLQDVAAAVTVSPGWTKDTTGGPTCVANDSDPWRAIPASATKIGGVPSTSTGRVDLVWGFKASTAQAAGTYTAGIVFQALAPSVGP